MFPSLQASSGTIVRKSPTVRGMHRDRDVACRQPPAVLSANITYFSLAFAGRRLNMMLYKGVGTSPKVRGAGKLPSHLEQKQTPLGNISLHICALIVLVKRFRLKIAFNPRPTGVFL